MIQIFGAEGKLKSHGSAIWCRMNVHNHMDSLSGAE